MPRQPRPRRVTVTVYLLDGREVPKGTSGAEKQRRQSATWYAVVDGRLVSLGTEDEGHAWTIWRQKLREAADRRLGILPTDDHERRPLAEHLADWLAVLQDKGTGAKQRGQVAARLTRLFALAGWTYPRDVTDDTLARGLARLLEPDGTDGRTKRRGRSPRTRNHYRTHARAFAAWLSGRLGRSLLTRDVRPLPVETDLRHQRRCPTDEEVAKLFTHLATPAARVRRAMTARRRAIGYRLCLGTGLRADELRTLTRSSFALQAEPPTVTVEASFSKHRRRDVIVLPPWLADDLRVYFDGRGLTWEKFPASNPGRLLRADLKAAGVEYRTRDGVFDMHALRVWYITQVASMPDIDPKHLQHLARHSTPSLSLQVYAKAKQERIARLAGAVPRPGETATEAATGKTGDVKPKDKRT